MVKKLKVLYIIDTLEGYGAEKSLVEITRCYENIIPVFVHIYKGDMLRPKLEDAGIKVYSLNITGKYSFKLALAKLRPIYIKENPDIIHATLYRSEIISRKLKKEFSEICLVGSFVSNAYSLDRYKINNPIQKLKLKYFHRIDKNSVKYTDWFISNSFAIKDINANALGVPLEKIKVIYRGRNSSDFSNTNYDLSSFPQKSDNFILLNISRLISLKGQMDILKALPGVLEKFPKVKVVFAGNGSYKQELENFIRKNSLTSHVEFLGKIENINALLHQSDLFIYPSYSEGLPGALIEAMMAEKIIICSDIPVNLECVNGNSALIYEKGNIEQLRDLIIKVIKDPAEYRELGRQARKQAQLKFELSQVTEKYEEFYQEIIKKVDKTPLTILHLIQKQQHRGAEIFTCQLAKHQKDLGSRVVIISVFDGNSTLEWSDEIKSLNGNPGAKLIDYKAWRKLNKIIKEIKPDIIQANSGDTLKYAILSKKIFRWRTPIIFRNASEVGRYLKSSTQKKFNSYLYRNVRSVASVSIASKNDLLKHYPFLKDRIEVIPIGLEGDYNPPTISLKPAGYKHIIHVGGFSFEKNHKGLINIYKRILNNNKNVRLHLIGDGPLRKEMEMLVKKEGLENYVYFYGFVNNPLSYIITGDVLVLPSIIEGLPGVILEAMYCRTPVVAYNVGGIKEILNSKTGHLIEKGDEEKFAEAVNKSLVQPDFFQIEEAYKMVMNKFRNFKIAKEFNKLYTEVGRFSKW